MNALSPNIYFALIVNILLVFKLWNDKRLHDDPDKRVNHWLSAVVDMTIYTVAGWFLLGWDVGGYLIVALGYRWFMFDILFNKLNKWHWAYCGNTSKMDEIGDELDGKDDERCYLMLVPKVLLIAGGVLIIIYLQ